MREKIENKLIIDVTGDEKMTTATDLVVWIRQGGHLMEYIPTVIDDSTIIVTIPFEDAMELNSSENAEVQLAGTDAEGNPFASSIVTERVDRLLKRGGYNGHGQT